MRFSSGEEGDGVVERRGLCCHWFPMALATRAASRRKLGHHRRLAGLGSGLFDGVAETSPNFPFWKHPRPKRLHSLHASTAQATPTGDIHHLDTWERVIPGDTMRRRSSQRANRPPLGSVSWQPCRTRSSSCMRLHVLPA